MEQYAGIDVSLDSASVCIVDAQGKILKEAKVACEPQALIAWLAAHGTPMARIGLEAGPLSQWLFAGLRAAGLPVELLETRHVRAAFTAMKRDRELWQFSRLRQVKYLNNIVEQDHRRIKRLVRPGLGFGSFQTARRTLAGYEAMAMIRKGQVRSIGGCDMPAQATFVATLFGIAA